MMHDARPDLDCRRCGYNLHSLNLAANCPECGLAVAESELPAGLALSTWSAVYRWRRALTWLVVGTLTGTLLNIAFTLFLWNWLPYRLAHPNGPRAFRPVGDGYYDGMRVATIFLFVGAIQVARAVHAEPWRRAVFRVRLMIGLSIIGIAVVVMQRLCGQSWYGLTGDSPWLSTVIAAICGISGTIPVGLAATLLPRTVNAGYSRLRSSALVAAGVLIMAESVVSAVFRAVGELFSLFSLNSKQISFSPYGFFISLLTIGNWWQQCVSGASQIVLMIAVLVVLRLMRVRSRMSQTNTSA